jgi:aminomethyltransferase
MRALGETGYRRSPLDDAHRRLGAKMVPFGGWEMPLSYPGGTIAEHLACRQHAVAFDVSHLGTVRVRGPGAFARLQATVTNDLAKISPGRAQYTHLLDPADASVVDDIIVWWVDDDRFDVMPNASNTDRVLSALTGAGGEATESEEPLDATDVTAGRAVIAVQGPDARAHLERVAPEAAAVPRFHVRRVGWAGADCVVAGTGYTGEDGVEVAIPADAAEELWRALLDDGVQPAGLGARDTLRLEAALPLHGHELGPGITPLQAGLGWVVAWDKPSGFLGKGPLVAERQRGVRRKLAGLSTPGRQPPRQGYAVTVAGETVGTVTSGNFSPVLGHGIALALLPPDLRAGEDLGVALEVEVRGRPLAATLTPLPFVRRGR